MKTTITWATLVTRKNGSVRVVERFLDQGAMATKRAEDARAALPDEVRDATIIVLPTTKVGNLMWSDSELDAVLVQCGQTDLHLTRPKKLQMVSFYMSVFDATRHDVTTGALTGAAYQSNPAPGETDMSDEKQGAKKKAAKKKGGAKKDKVAVPTKTPTGKKAAKPTDGLGREGTPARFIRERLARGEDPEKIAKEGAKKFPDNPITTTYVKWYANDMKKKGLLK